MGRRGKANRPFLSFTFLGQEVFVKIRKPKQIPEGKKRNKRAPRVANKIDVDKDDIHTGEMASIADFEMSPFQPEDAEMYRAPI